MPYTLYLPLTWDQTIAAVRGDLWARWTARQPALGPWEDLPQLPARMAASPALGDEVTAALLGICADLTGPAARSSSSNPDCAHQRDVLLSLSGHLLGHVISQVCSRLSGSVRDVDLAVTTALWLALCEGASTTWACPRSSLGWRVWSLAVEGLGGQTRTQATHAARTTYVSAMTDEDLDLLWDHSDRALTVRAVADEPGLATSSVWSSHVSTARSEIELRDLIEAARRDPEVDAAHLDLLVELVTTAVEGTMTATDEQPWHFNHEVDVVARRHGINARTIRRRRARAVAAVRQAALAWDTGTPRPGNRPTQTANIPQAA